MARRRKLLTPEAEQVMDQFKYEVAAELGLADKIARQGWGEMTTRECGKVGGTMVRKMIDILAPDRRQWPGNCPSLLWYITHSTIPRRPGPRMIRMGLIFVCH